MDRGTTYLLMPKMVGDNAVYDCGHGAFFLVSYLSKLL
jgi:hypothetical protein